MNSKGFNIKQDLSNTDYMIHWNINFYDFLFIIKNIVFNKVTSVDLEIENYYSENGVRNDFDLYLSELGFR